MASWFYLTLYDKEKIDFVDKIETAISYKNNLNSNLSLECSESGYIQCENRATVKLNKSDDIVSSIQLNSKLGGA